MYIVYLKYTKQETRRFMQGVFNSKGRFIVGRSVGRMRPIWRVIAAITPMRRPHAAAGGTVVKHWKSHYNMTL